jgi:nucleoside-diphosphate-sugar epimerase
MRGRRVFLTGATGFIGSHVARQLVETGCTVTVLVRPAASRQRLADIAESLMFVEGDFTAPGGCADLLRATRPDLLLHLGWYAEPGRWLDSPRHVDCLTGSLELLRALPESGCRRAVLAGTSVEYDTEVGYPTETSPLRPRTLYGACKAALFFTAQQLARLEGWSLAEARIFNVYGPWEDDRRLVSYLISHMLEGKGCEITSGEQVRDYLHVGDVAGALLAVAASDLEGPVNIGSGRPVTVASLARTIGELLGASHLLHAGARARRPGEYDFLCANTELLRRRVGWNPRYDLEEGLRQTAEWWKRQAGVRER